MANDDWKDCCDQHMKWFGSECMLWQLILRVLCKEAVWDYELDCGGNQTPDLLISGPLPNQYKWAIDSHHSDQTLHQKKRLIQFCALGHVQIQPQAMITKVAGKSEQVNCGVDECDWHMDYNSSLQCELIPVTA